MDPVRLERLQRQVEEATAALGSLEDKSGLLIGAVVLIVIASFVTIGLGVYIFYTSCERRRRTRRRRERERRAKEDPRFPRRRPT